TPSGLRSFACALANACAHKRCYGHLPLQRANAREGEVAKTRHSYRRGFLLGFWKKPRLASLGDRALAWGRMNRHGFLGRLLLRFSELEAPFRRLVFATFVIFLAVALATAMSDLIGGPDLASLALFHFPRNIFIGGVAIAVASVSLVLAGAAHL